jgi:hypothetical protein
MMTAERILALLNARASDFNDRASAKVASIGLVSEDEETKEQRSIRASAQGDWEAAGALLRVIAEIEG